MSDIVRIDELPLLLGPPMSQAEGMPELLLFRVPQIHNHGPGEYCIFCPCDDCCKFYGKSPVPRCVEPLEPIQPSYGDIGFVNSMRAAAAKREEDRQEKLRAERKREEDRQEKLRAERKGTAGAAEAAKREKSSEDQAKKKTSRTGMKRRRL